MLVILGSAEDRLTAEVHQRAASSAGPVLLLGESELFGATPFRLEISGAERSGFLQRDGGAIALNEISGVLFRLPRLWWPSPQFDVQDQVFVYHETASSWFCLLSGLACVQINRFGLGWWVHDCCYPDQLREQVAGRLGVAAVEPPLTDQRAVRVFPTPVTEAADARHVYVIGDTVLPRTAADNQIAAQVKGRRSALAQWQQLSGISFCRLDFRQNRTLELAYVEPMPMVDDEPPEIAAKVADEIARRLL